MALAVFPPLVVVDVLLGSAGLGRTQRIVGALVPLRSPSARPVLRGSVRPEEVATAVDRVARRYRPGRMCLRRAVLLWALLRWHGVEAAIVLGVRRETSGLAAHAWLEASGSPILEAAPSLIDFAALAGPQTQPGGP